MKQKKFLFIQYVIRACFVFLFCTSGAFASADLTRLDTLIKEKIKKVVIAFENGPRFVAAVQTNNNEMKLFSFSTSGGQLSQLDSLAVPVSISQIKIAYSPLETWRTQNDMFITASRKTNGELRLDLIELLEDGTLERVDTRVERNYDVSNDISISSLPLNHTNRFVVVTKTPTGTLSLKGYEHDLESMSFQDSSGGQQVKSVAVQMENGSVNEKIFVGVQNQHNDLQVLLYTWHKAWYADLEFDSDNVQSGYPAGTIGSINMPSADPESDIITAVQDSQGKLKLISWADNCHPEPILDCSITRLQDGSAGTASNIQIAQAPNIRNRYVTTHKTANGDLRVLAWKRNGDTFSKVGSNVASNESLGTAKKASVGIAKSGRVVTAVRDGLNRLRIMLWHIAW